MTHLTFIAGGSKGLGAELVQICQSNQHQVFEFSRSGQGEHHIACDFKDMNASQQAFELAFEKPAIQPEDTVNLIINTAVLAPFGPLAKADEQTLMMHLTININSTLLLLKSFLAIYQDHPGNKTISYISSGAARRAIPGLAVYSASKAFFERYIDTLAEEQTNQPHPFKCMVINPGVMDTGMQAEIRSQDADDFPMVDMWHEFHEKGQLVDPKDIANVCYRLMTEEGENAGYYTAQGYLPY